MSTTSSSPGFSAKKGRFIQPGNIVTAPYGHLDAVVSENPDTQRKRRSRARIRGAVLRSHSENNWLVHWFEIGKTAHVSFSKLQIEPESDRLTETHIEALLFNQTKNYIGGVDELRDYIDNFYAKDVHQKKKRAEPSFSSSSTSPTKSVATPPATKRPAPILPRATAVATPSPAVGNFPKPPADNNSLFGRSGVARGRGESRIRF